VFAMAANGDLPRFFAAVHPRYRVPHRAELGVGACVAVLTSLGDLRLAIGFSSFAVLTYYAIANAAAWTLPLEERAWPRWLSLLGLFGCMTLAIHLPLASVLAGALLLLGGVAVFLVRQTRSGSELP
jgi:basic amino acid/polyamine antiporter, APA family